MAVEAYLSPRLRMHHSHFFGRLWMEFILDSDTRAASDFEPRWVALVGTIIPGYAIPVARDPEADIAAAEAAADAVAAAFGLVPAASAPAASTPAGPSGAAPGPDGAGPSSAALPSLSRETRNALLSYFNTLWELRDKWAGVFVRSSLILTMLTTGRAESWHNVLKSALNYSGQTTLENLILNHNRVLDDLWEKIEPASAKRPLRIGFSNMVVDAARKALSDFAADFVATEAKAAQTYIVRTPPVQDGEALSYTVLRPDGVTEGPTGTERCRADRIVTVTIGADRAVATGMKCSCQMLTSVGLPCRHVLSVLNVRQEAQTLPPYLYHLRWAREGPKEVDLLAALAVRVASAPRVALHAARAPGRGEVSSVITAV